jgi:preprotein translocase subunit SecD
MDTAVQTRLTLYEQSFSDLLREESIVSRVDISGNEIIVRVRNLDDLEIAEDLIREADIDLLIIDNQADRTLRISMTETQIRARQDFAIEQNITTLRNRVNQLGVAEPWCRDKD